MGNIEDIYTTHSEDLGLAEVKVGRYPHLPIDWDYLFDLHD